MIRNQLGLELGLGLGRMSSVTVTPCSGETVGEIRGLRHDEVRVAHGFGHMVLVTGTWGIG